LLQNFYQITMYWRNFFCNNRRGWSKRPA